MEWVCAVRVCKQGKEGEGECAMRKSKRGKPGKAVDGAKQRNPYE